MSENGAYEGPAIIELMGHRRLAGHVSEVDMYGAKLLRVDVPGQDGQQVGATQFYSAASIYCLTPTTEEMVQKISAGNRVRPVERWELPAADSSDPADYDEEVF